MASRAQPDHDSCLRNWPIVKDRIPRTRSFRPVVGIPAAGREADLGGIAVPRGTLEIQAEMAVLGEGNKLPPQPARQSTAVKDSLALTAGQRVVAGAGLSLHRTASHPEQEGTGNYQRARRARPTSSRISAAPPLPESTMRGSPRRCRTACLLTRNIRRIREISRLSIGFPIASRVPRSGSPCQTPIEEAGVRDLMPGAS